MACFYFYIQNTILYSMAWLVFTEELSQYANVTDLSEIRDDHSHPRA